MTNLITVHYLSLILNSVCNVPFLCHKMHSIVFQLYISEDIGGMCIILRQMICNLKHSQKQEGKLIQEGSKDLTYCLLLISIQCKAGGMFR